MPRPSLLVLTDPIEACGPLGTAQALEGVSP